jgi:hypothetical protein
MLPEDLKSDVLEIVAIAKACPENLEERCFELLLVRYLEGLGTPLPGNKIENLAAPPAPQVQHNHANHSDNSGGTDGTASGEDLTLPDVHVKARKFLEKYGRSITDLNQLFYKENGELKPLYEDLKTTKITESQMRIALLAALKEGITTGEFVFDGEAVRDECQVRKCYDKANFATIFKRNAALFDAFNSYTPESPKIRLSESGKELLSGLIVELR